MIYTQDEEAYRLHDNITHLKFIDNTYNTDDLIKHLTDVSTAIITNLERLFIEQATFKEQVLENIKISLKSTIDLIKYIVEKRIPKLADKITIEQIYNDKINKDNIIRPTFNINMDKKLPTPYIQDIQMEVNTTNMLTPTK